MALPFVFGEGQLDTYLEKSAFSIHGRTGFPFVTERSLSIFWQFVSSEMYDSQSGADIIRPVIIVFNLYHFFIRKKCLPKALEEIVDTFKGKNPFIRTHEQLKISLEILILGFLTGVLIMPGANIEVQCWYTFFVPLLIEMIGLPSLYTFWIYSTFFPLTKSLFSEEAEDSRPQHLFMLAILIWLTTVCPKYDIVAYFR